MGAMVLSVVGESSRVLTAKQLFQQNTTIMTRETAQPWSCQCEKRDQQ